MKVKLIIILIVLLLVMVFACGCIPVMEKLGLVNPASEEQLTPEKGGPPDGLVKVLIGFKEKPGAAQQAMVKGVGGKIKYTYNIIPAIAASVPEVAIEALQKNPNITNVELDSKVYALDVELDNSWGVERIGAGIAHSKGYTGSGVKVAVIDSGIDDSHDELSIEDYYDFINDSHTNPVDGYGHGTHVAGIIAAEKNGAGAVGVAPDVLLYDLKALGDDGSGWVSDIIEAIQWTSDPNGNGKAEDRLDIINMSFGAEIGNIFLKWACNLAYRDGLLLVAAAGNEYGGSVGYPAAYDRVVAVSATNSLDEIAYFSSTGSEVELAAPGEGIYSTVPGGGYDSWSGTSMACPHVVGTAALVWADNPSWRNKDVRARLQNTAEDIGLLDTEQGYGLVNAAEAVGVGIPPPGNGTIEGNVIDASTSDIIEGATVVVEGPDLPAYTDQEGNYVITNVPVGTYTVTASANGYKNASQYVEVTANATSIADFTLSSLPANGTMHVDSITFSKKKAGPNYFLYITVRVVDGSSIPLEGAGVEMTLTNRGSLWYFVGDTGSGGTVGFTLKKAPSGSYTATVTGLTLSGYDWNEGSFASDPYTLE